LKTESSASNSALKSSFTTITTKKSAGNCEKAQAKFFRKEAISKGLNNPKSFLKQGVFLFGNLFDEERLDNAVKEYGVEHKSDSYNYASQAYGSGSLFVVSVSGKAIVGEELNERFLRDFSQKISQLHSQGLKFALVVGKGSIARDFVETAKQFNPSKAALDEIALQFSKANALMLAQALDAAHPKIITEFSEAVSALDNGRIPIMVQSIAGLSTEATAALAAEYLGGTLVNLADVKGVFAKNPSEKKRQKLLKSVSFDQLLDLSLEMNLEPEGEAVFDVFSEKRQCESFCFASRRFGKL